MFVVGVLGGSSYARIDQVTAVGIYLFDEEKADEAEDLSGKGHTGMFQGGNGKWEDGKFGSAVDPRNGWVRIDSADDLHPVDEWSIVAWFSIENLADVHNVIVTKWDEYLLRVDRSSEGKNVSCFVKPGGNWEPRAKGGVPETETWIHVAVVWSNNENGALRIYRDGVQIAQSIRPGKITGNENPLCIGSRNGGSVFPGLIDEVGIFNVALEEEDIKSIIENGLEIAVFGKVSVEPHTALAVTWGQMKAE
jgi:hypothetical protein